MRVWCEKKKEEEEEEKGRRREKNASEKNNNKRFNGCFPKACNSEKGTLTTWLFACLILFCVTSLLLLFSP